MSVIIGVVFAIVGLGYLFAATYSIKSDQNLLV